MNGGSSLPEIPLVEAAGEDWPLEVLERHVERAHALLDMGTRHVPGFALTMADRASRRWLAKWDNPRLAEIDRVAALVGRPGAHFLNVSYEWGCTTRVAPGPDGAPQLVRVLDWPTRGLGRHAMAIRVAHGPTPWISLAWPGYTGVLTALAPKRFAAALNQAPMEMPLGFLPVDWAINRRKVWRSAHPTPVHLLRDVFELCESYDEAKRRLIETPIAAPTFYSLAGLDPGQGCMIERLQTEARVHEMPTCVANDWLSDDLKGHVRGPDNAGRKLSLSCALIHPEDQNFEWLRPPVMNQYTRLATVMQPSTGQLRALGVEEKRPATQLFEQVFA